MKTLITSLLITVTWFAAETAPAVAISPVEVQLGEARASFKDGTLFVTTEAITREWKWTGHGLATTRLSDAHTGATHTREPAHSCDWNLPDQRPAKPGWRAAIQPD